MTDVHALSGAYAVDALDDLERARFERHLSECPDCQAEVAGLREASALLADTVAVTPPPALREQVLAGITSVRPLPPVVSEHAAEAARRPRRRLRGLLVAAAAVTVLGTGVAIVQPWDDDSTSHEEPPQLTAIEQVLNAPDRRRIVQAFEDGSKATVVVSADLSKAVVVTEDMAPPPPGKVYELWYQHGDEMVPAGIMPDDPDATVLLDGEADEAAAVGITVEPEGGSPEPTTQPVALFPIDA
jgi:anti-sigma-K factor RskA